MYHNLSLRTQWASRKKPREIISTGRCKAIRTVFLSPDSLASNQNMAPVGVESVVARAELIAQEFEYGAEDVRRGVKEYLRLMGELARAPVSGLRILIVLIEVGLRDDGQAMTMIPTYVTGVPNGTEKVCSSRGQQMIRSQGSSHLLGCLPRSRSGWNELPRLFGCSYWRRQFYSDAVESTDTS